MMPVERAWSGRDAAVGFFLFRGIASAPGVRLATVLESGDVSIPWNGGIRPHAQGVPRPVRAPPIDFPFPSVPERSGFAVANG
jgi:hypothetical protein